MTPCFPCRWCHYSPDRDVRQLCDDYEREAAPMADRTCETCRSYLEPGKRARNGQRYFTAVCQHRQVANRHGILAVSLARADDGPCGPAGKGWGAR